MKKVFIFVLVFLCSLNIFASDYQKAFLQDIGIRVGQGSIVFGEDDQMGLHGLVGMTFGIAERIEFDPEIMFEIMPSPCSDLVAGFEVGYAILGNRVSKMNTAGTGLNMIISAGLFASNHSDDGKFVPTYLTLRLTPVTCGTSYAGRRESLLPVGVAWNFRENKFSLFVSVLLYDHYIKGRWEGSL